MQTTISQSILKLIRENATAPRPDQLAGARIITEVADHCIAASAQIKRGDLILGINGHPPALADETSRNILCDQVDYSIWDKRNHQLLHLQTNGTPLGVNTRRTYEAMRAQLSEDRQTFADPYDLLDVWQNRNWHLLNDLTRLYLKQSRNLRCRNSFLRRLWLMLSHDAWDAPALLFRGALLYERGHIRSGMAMIHKYLDHFAGYWTLDMRGVAQFYLARNLQANGHIQDAIETLQQAYSAYPMPAISRSLARLTGHTPAPAHQWAGLAFPVMYQFPILSDIGPYGMLEASLEETLGTMNHRQILAICCLAGYRGNGPYNEFMRRFMGYYRHFSDMLCGLHVITANPNRPSNRQEWFLAEDAARQRHLPYCVLHDRSDRLTSVLGLRRSPTIYLLDHTGTILHEGWLNSDVEWWNALYRAGKNSISSITDAPGSDVIAGQSGDHHTARTTRVRQ